MGPVAGRRGARLSRRSGRRKPLREAPSFQVHKSGHTALMLGMTMGALLAGATIIGLAWDWYRHPHLKDLNPPPRRPGRRTDAVPRRLLLARRRTPALSQVQRTRLPLGRAFRVVRGPIDQTSRETRSRRLSHRRGKPHLVGEAAKSDQNVTRAARRRLPDGERQDEDCLKPQAMLNRVPPRGGVESHAAPLLSGRTRRRARRRRHSAHAR
jgi:hypothetical protein